VSRGPVTYGYRRVNPVSHRIHRADTIGLETILSMSESPIPKLLGVSPALVPHMCRHGRVLGWASHYVQAVLYLPLRPVG